MSSRGKKLLKAWLDTPSSGKIELSHDWRARYNPPLVLIGKEPVRWSRLTRVPDYLFGCDSAYFVNRNEEIFFFLRLSEHPELNTAGAPAVYVAGDFNGWSEAIGDPEWALQRSDLDGEAVLMWRGAASAFFSHPWQRFKFVTGEGHWLPVPAHAPNSMGDETGNVNRVIDPDRTGQHLFQFTLDQPLDLAETWKVGWSD
ncbi:MAG TPA: glycoside hydrolase family 1, partial [Opitutaceae bacterium]|nr:glycoside hydrolase family 1 [Opitutaceae bacterium]